MHAELIAPRKDQTGVLLETSADGDQVQTVFLEQVVGERGGFDGTDRADGHLVADCLFDFDREWGLIGGLNVWVLGWVVAA